MHINYYVYIETNNNNNNNVRRSRIIWWKIEWMDEWMIKD
jgi:hypothetical protein